MHGAYRLWSDVCSPLRVSVCRSYADTESKRLNISLRYQLHVLAQFSGVKNVCDVRAFDETPLGSWHVYKQFAIFNRYCHISETAQDRDYEKLI